MGVLDRAMADSGGRLAGDEARSRLYEVMRADDSVEDRIRQALAVGTEYLGVEHGYVTEVDPETDDWEVAISVDPDSSVVPEGLSIDYSTTYCRRTIEKETVVALHDAPDDEYESHPDFESHGFHCYLGTPVVVDSELFGTVCFVSHEAREEPFTDPEKAFTDLIAQMVGSEIARKRRQEALDERERELEERRELYRAVIDASFDMVFRFDADGVYTYHSPGSEELLGYSPDELLGERYTFLLPNEAVAEKAETLFERVLAGETVEEPYLPLETAAGDIIYVDIRVTPIYAADVPAAERTPDDVVALQGMTHDATERKRREQLNNVLSRVLRHNLRNDMGIVRGYAETLKKRTSAENRELVERILGTADHLLQLGDTARRLEEHVTDSAETEPIDVVPMVSETIDQLEKQYPEASVSLDAPEEALAQTAPQLKTAVWELLDNAARHSCPDPTVDVAIRVTDGQVTITVADDGPGLPEDERTVLETGEETSLVHGSGLGLWLVYWIVSSVRGEIRVSDTAGGACIALEFPRVEE